MLWRESEHEPLTERAWTAGWAQAAIQEIVADAETAASADGEWPFHPRDDPEEGEVWSGLYLGSAGMAWALWKLDSTFDVASAVANALERYRASPDFMQDPHPPSLLCGEGGILVAAERVGSPAADRERLRELIRANRSHPTWELMWGSPGTMLAARAFSFEQEWRESAELLWAQWDEETDLWTQHLYGHVVQLLGPAHGFAGNVNALRGFVGEEVLRERVARLMERTALRDDGLVNWPPEPERPAEKIRVQWCHGAPGIIDHRRRPAAVGAGAGRRRTDLARRAAAQGARPLPRDGRQRLCLPAPARAHRRPDVARSRPPLRRARGGAGAARARGGRPRALHAVHR